MFRFPVVALFLVVTISALSGSSATSQQVQTVTSTTLFTATTTATSYSFSTYTNYATSVNSQQELYSGPFTIIAVPAQYGCELYNLPFTANKGNEIAGSYSADRLVSFIIMTKSFFQNWNQFEVNANPNQILLERDGVNSGKFVLTITHDDTYEFVFLNSDHNHPANVNFQSQLVGASITTTSTEARPSVFTNVQTLTLTSSSLVFQTVQTPMALPGIDTSLILIAALVVVVIAIVAFLALRRRGAAGSAQGTPSAATVEKPVKSEMFCKECGARIPRDSKFCQKCGTTVA